MSTRLVGARIEVPAGELEAAKAEAGELRGRLGGEAVDVLASPVDSERGHVWVLAQANGDGPEPAAVREACRSVLGSGEIVSFSATLFREHREPEDSGMRASHVLFVPFAAPADQIEDLDAWYDEEHVDWLLSVPGWLRTRRYDVQECSGESWNRLVLHDLADGDIIRHPEVVRSQQTPWRDRFAGHEWFMAGGRWPMERL